MPRIALTGSVRKMQVHNLEITICLIVPKLDCEPVVNVYTYGPACRVSLDKINEVRRKFSDLTEATNEIPLLALF